MTSGLHAAIVSHLPAGAAEKMAASGQQIGAGSVLDPSVMAKLPPAVAEAVRQGLAERLHDVFLLGLPILAVVFLTTAMIKSVPLRTSNHAPASAEEAGHELLDGLSSSAAEPADQTATDERVPVAAR